MSIDLTVHFVGICTHVWWEELPQFTGRVVLVNATAGATIDGHIIPPHYATLRIAASDIVDLDGMPPGTGDPIVQWMLNGERIRIENATDAAVGKHSSFESCVPHLADHATNLGPPDSAVVDGSDASLTAAIFDITGGTLHGGANYLGGASTSYLTASTGGEDPRLLLTPFGTGVPRLLTLRAGAEITLSNIGDDDGDYDFYLHFKTAADMPTGKSTPAGATENCSILKRFPKTWPPGAGSVGPGCSNSTYP